MSLVPKTAANVEEADFWSVMVSETAKKKKKYFGNVHVTLKRPHPASDARKL